MNGACYREITLCDSQYLAQMIALYEATFALAVREPSELFLKSLAHGMGAFPDAYHIHVALDGEAQGNVIGFVTGHYFADVNVGFIVYLAIDPSYRRQGIGAQLLLQLEKSFEEDACAASFETVRAIVLETEREDGAKSESEREDGQRRQRFFQAKGFVRREEIDYRQPPLRVGDEKVPLYLWVKNRATNPINLEQWIAIVEAMYREKYHKINGIDQKLLHAMIYDATTRRN